MALWWRQTKQAEANNNSRTTTESAGEENPAESHSSVPREEENGNLQVAPYGTTYSRVDGAVERILSVALSALIAVLLAWRFLLSDGTNNSFDRKPHAVYLGSEEEEEGSDSNDEGTRAIEAGLIPAVDPQKKPSTTNRDNNIIPDDNPRLEQWGVKEARNFRENIPAVTPLESRDKKEDNSQGNDPDFFESSGLSTKIPSSPTTSSTRRPLVTDTQSSDGGGKDLKMSHFSGRFPDSSSEDPIMEEASVDSVSSDEERGTLPAYLDTISEEDTDDLLSLSSGRSLVSPRLPLQASSAQIKAVRERLAKNQQQLDSNHNDLTLPPVETKAETNGRQLNSSLEPLPNVDDSQSPPFLSRQRCDASSASSRGSTPDSSVKSDDGEESSLSDKDSDERTILTASDSTLKASATELDALHLPTTTSVDNIIATNDFLNGHSLRQSLSQADYPLLSPTAAGETDSNPGEINPTLPLLDSNFAPLSRERVESPNTRFYRAYHDYFDRNSNVSMSDSDSTTKMDQHINLSESMKKFAHYGQVYGDARSSDLEELKPKKQQDSSSSRSSSLVSVEGVPMDLEVNGNQSTPKPKPAIQQPSQIPVPLRLKEKSPEKHCLQTSEISDASKVELELETSAKRQTNGSIENGNTGGTSFSTRPVIGSGVESSSVTVHNSGVVRTGAAESEERERGLSSAVGVPPNTTQEFHSVSLLAQRPVYCTTDLPLSSATQPPKNRSQEGEKKVKTPTFTTPHQSKGAIFSLGQQKKNSKESELRPIKRSPDLSPTSVDTSTTEEDTDTVVIASATSRLVAGDKEEKVLGEATANAVSKNPYVALARATANAASKLSSTAQPPEDNQKVSVIVASTVTTTKKELSSPKSRSSFHEPGLTFLSPSVENFSEDSVFGSSKDMYGTQQRFDSSRANYGPHLQPEPEPRYSVAEKSMKMSSSTDSLTLRTVTESVTYKRTTTASPVTLEMMNKLAGAPPVRDESPERKRPLLQQNQQVYYRQETTQPSPNTNSFTSSSRDNRGGVHQRKNMSSAIHETPTRSRTEMGYQPEPQRILPPSLWIQEEPVLRVVSPSAPSHLSTENIQRMVEEPYFGDKRKSREDSYKEKGKSRETLFSNVPTTPTMTYMVAKVPERPPSRGPPLVAAEASLDPRESAIPLSQENVSLWASLPENTANSKQNLMRWRNSMHLDEDEVLASLMNATNEVSAVSQPRPPSTNQLSTGNAARAQSPYSVESTADSAVAKQRVYQRQLEDERMENARNSRRAKYRSKIEKARSDYITTASANGSASDLYKTPEDFQRKFQVSMEEIRRPPAQLRGPLLEKFNSPYFNSKIDLNKLPPTAYARMPPSRYDKEYNEIVSRAERLWAAYKNRITPPKENLYSRSRAYSASYLETNVDTGEDREVSAGEIKVEETDLEDVHRSGHSIHSLGAARQQQQLEHQSRGRMREQPEQRDPKNRAKSVDYLMDRRARTEIEPPENQLKKILGEPAHEPPEEEVWRFRKSTEKLHVPDWYLNSDYCPGKVDLNRSYFERISNSGVQYQPERPKSATPYVLAERPDRPGTSQSTYSGYNQQPKGYDQYSGLRQTAQSQRPTTKPAPPPHNKPAQEPTNQSRYVSPWTYGGRFSGPHGTVQNQVKKVQENRMTTSQTTNWNQKFAPEAPKPSQRQQAGDGLYIPSDFFDKYREEIEELRKSRTSLLGGPSSVEHSSLSGQLPVAAVKPRPSGTLLDQSSSTLSSPSMKRYDLPPGPQTSSASTGVPSRPSTIGPFPGEEQEGSFGMGMVTSTPRNSDQLPRKAPVPAPRTSFSRDPQPQMQQSQERQRNIYEEDRRTVTTTQRTETERAQRQHQGWTVSAPPPDWNMPRNRDSRVIEVTDTFFDARRTSSGQEGRRLAGHVTLDEVLDSLLALPGHQRRLSTLDESSGSLNASVSDIRPKTPTSLSGPAIYTQNYRVMEQCERSPEKAEQLLKHETLYVQCDYCGRTKELSEARRRYVTCRHCYTYYCARQCRRAGWDRHKGLCTFARVNTTCKEIILKVREDPDAQWQMSRVARQGNTNRGRGSVNFRFRSLPLAETYVNGGWNALSRHPGNYLYYYTVPDLVEGRKDPNLIALCRRYDPRAKFILSVSIVADVEECPETPPPERNSWRKPVSNPQQQHYDVGQQQERPVFSPQQELDMRQQQRERPVFTPQQPVSHPPPRPASEMNGRINGADSESDYYASRTRSLPKRYQHQSRENGGVPDAKTLLKSVLRSMENIAPGDPVVEDKYGLYERPDSSFDRSNRNRHTVDSSPWKPKHYNSTPLVYDGKAYLGQPDDGTDV